MLSEKLAIPGGTSIRIEHRTGSQDFLARRFCTDEFAGFVPGARHVLWPNFRRVAFEAQPVAHQCRAPDA